MTNKNTQKNMYVKLEREKCRQIKKPTEMTNVMLTYIFQHHDSLTYICQLINRNNRFEFLYIFVMLLNL